MTMDDAARNLPGGSEEDSVRIGCVPVEISLALPLGKPIRC
jgi:hypothetical protein